MEEQKNSPLTLLPSLLTNWEDRDPFYPALIEPFIISQSSLFSKTVFVLGVNALLDN